jgi:hypothetical protein
MLDTKGPNGYTVQSDGECITVYDSAGKAILSYHPLQGEVPMQVMLSARVMEQAREDFEYARRMLSRSPHPVQCES